MCGARSSWCPSTTGSPSVPSDPDGGTSFPKEWLPCGHAIGAVDATRRRCYNTKRMPTATMGTPLPVFGTPVALLGPRGCQKNLKRGGPSSRADMATHGKRGLLDDEK